MTFNFSQVAGLVRRCTACGGELFRPAIFQRDLSLVAGFRMIFFIAGLFASVQVFAGGGPSIDWAALTAKDAVPGELLVGFKPSAKGVDVKAMEAKRAVLHAKVGAQLKRSFTLVPVHSVRLPEGMSLKAAAAMYAADPDVAYVEPNYKQYALALPNDPQYGSLWGMPRIHASEAWDKTTGSTNILVGIIDTGIDRNHPDLLENMWENPGETGLDGGGNDKKTNGFDDDGNGYVDDWRGWDFVNDDNDPFDDDDHGTHCAGTIGAVGNNGVGVVGVNWTVKMVGLKFLGPFGGSTADAIDAVQYASIKIPGVRLTSNSWGGGGFSQALKDAIDAAGAAGQLFIAAAGNSADNNDVLPHYPSSYSCENIIAVASIQSSGAMSSFSCYGLTSVDIAAPGSDILSTKPGAGYQTMSGTSMATPHVSGVAALLLSLSPALSWQELKDVILSGARANAALTGKVVTGGELDLTGSIALLNPPVLDQSYFYVMENETTNINVTLFQAPDADVVVTVTRQSGSSNLYVVGTPALTFTPANWSTPQSFAVGSLNDADMTNDTAIFLVSSSGGGSTEFTLQQMDIGDTIPPQCVITGRGNGDQTEVIFDFQFDEPVLGFDGNEIEYASTVVGGVSFLGLADLTGQSQHYQARFSLGSRFGSISIRIPAGRMTDISGHPNPNPEYRSTYTIPFARTDFFDDFEGVATTWTKSTNDYEDFTTDGWRWSEPVFGFDWYGPVTAFSGQKCWGTMDGPFAKRLDGWIDSPKVHVGANPVLSFYLWVQGSYGLVEVNNGSGWYDVTPGGAYTFTSDWEGQQIVLDNDLFGNREIQVRFRAVSSGVAMYVDDVRITSEQPAGVYLVSVNPASGLAGTTVPVTNTVYNSMTSSLSSVVGFMSCAEAGVSITGGVPVWYGTLAPGALGSNVAPVQVALGVAGSFDSSRIRLNHRAMSGGGAISDDVIFFDVLSAGVTPATNLLTVRSSSGVTNWVGSFLPGDGSPTSCLFQVVYAGADGVIDPPDADGGTTGDDRLLYGADISVASGRIGEGGVVPNGGLFSKVMAHGLASNALVYVRAWDAASFSASSAYGDSALKAVRLVSGETIDFGSWGVVHAVNYPGASLAELADRDGDSIPDAWCLLFGIDPNRPIVPLGSAMTIEGMVTGLNRPGRVAVSSNKVFIADSDNNRIEVWDRALTNRLSRYGSFGAATNKFNRPQGLSVNADGTRLMVADTLNSRLSIFSVDPVTGVLTHLLSEGIPGSSVPLSFSFPFAIAYGAGDSFCVADSHSSMLANNRVQCYPSVYDWPVIIGTETAGQFTRPLGVDVGFGGEIYVADSGNHRVQGFLSDGSPSWVFGAYGTNGTEFKDPRDVNLGVGGRLYVAEAGGNRIHVLDVGAAPVVESIAFFGSSGSEPGKFRAPQGVAPVMDDGVIYVADTYNNRVQKLRVKLDADGDGMEDVWEDLNGLDSHDPLDAFEDADGDGLSNIGEFRLGTDPQRRDTNGNGASDGWDVAHGLNPLAAGGPMFNPPTVVITSDAASVVYAGSVVRVTATFSEPVTNAPGPKLTLDGGAFLWQAAMTQSGPSTWVYDYTVQTGDMGAVNASVSGAVDLDGYSLDLDPTVTNGLFTAGLVELEISSFGGVPLSMSWESVMDGIYQIQNSYDLMSNVWTEVGAVTSSASGPLMWTNTSPATNALEFFRVRWMNMP